MLSTSLHLTAHVMLFACASSSPTWSCLKSVRLPALFEDNQTCVKMSESLASTPRMQHLDARCHWPREQVVHDKTLRLVYVNTLDQVADCLTKPLSADNIR